MNNARMYCPKGNKQNGTKVLEKLGRNQAINYAGKQQGNKEESMHELQQGTGKKSIP